jgi:hypothetical protein
MPAYRRSPRPGTSSVPTVAALVIGACVASLTGACSAITTTGLPTAGPPTTAFATHEGSQAELSPSPAVVPSVVSSPHHSFSVWGELPGLACASATLENGHVVVLGEPDAGGAAFVAVLDPSTENFHLAGSLPVSCGTGGTADCPSAVIAMPGGRALVSTTADMGLPVLYVLEADTNTAIILRPPADMAGCQSAQLLGDGRILLFGGVSDSGYSDQGWVFDPEAGDFTKTGRMATARVHAGAARLTDGRVLIAGGDQGDTSPDPLSLSAAEIYDPRTGLFQKTGSMTSARTHLAIAPLLDGRALVVGGDQPLEPSFLSSAEVYDPLKGGFSTAGSMSTGRSIYVGAVTLEDGTVLVAGGDGGKATAELFDPVTTRFGAPIQAPDQIDGYAGIRLADGSVLFPGQPSLLYWP